MQTTTTMTIRLEKKTRERLERLAATNGLTLSRYVRYVLGDYVRAECKKLAREN